MACFVRDAGRQTAPHGGLHEARPIRARQNPAAFVLSRLPHPDAQAAGRDAFVHAATGRAISFPGLRRAALALASALRLGLGLRRGDAVLVLAAAAAADALLLPPVILGVLAAGGVVVTADPDGAAAEIAAVAHGSGAAMVVASPEVAEKVAAGVVGVPLLLTSRSLDPRTLSAEELMDGGDPTALADHASPEEVAVDRHGRREAALMIYSSAGTKVVITHTELITAVAGAALPDEAGHVCLASLPPWDAGLFHGLALLALGLPAAGVTTVLMSPASDPREAVAAHGATDVVATPEIAAALAAPTPQGVKLSTLRRVMVVAQAPLAPEAREAFRRRLPWVDLAEMSGKPEKGTEPALKLVPVAPAELGNLGVLVQPETARAAAVQQEGQMADQMSVRNETTTLVPPLKKIQKTVLEGIFTNSITAKILRKHPVACNKQAVSRL